MAQKEKKRSVSNQMCLHVFFFIAQRSFIHHYLAACKITPTEEEIEKLFLETQLFQLGPHFLWAFWSLASGISSEMNFDYMVCLIKWRIDDGLYFVHTVLHCQHLHIQSKMSFPTKAILYKKVSHNCRVRAAS